MLENIVQWIQYVTIEGYSVYQVFLGVFITLLITYIWKRIYLKLDKQFKKTKNKWDDAIVLSISTPITMLILGIGSSFIIDDLGLGDGIVTLKMRVTFLLVLLSWTIVRFIHQAEKNLIESNVQKDKDKKFDKSTIEAFSKLLRASVSVTAILVILQTLGVSISAVLAFGGIGGIAIGFAAKDLLANFFGGFIIYLDRPFAVGDWIRSSDREIEGTVEYIGWRQTRIRTFDKRPLYVPNAIFNSITVENPSRMTNRRIYETFGIRYDDIKQAEGIVQQVKKMLIAHPEIDTQQTMIVNLIAFSESSVDFFVYTFTKTTDWIKFHAIKQDVLLKIALVIEENKAELAYPTQRLQLENLRGDS